MSLQKWKELAEKRRLVKQYYKEKDKAIKDYKLRRGVSFDFYERVITETSPYSFGNVRKL